MLREFIFNFRIFLFKKISLWILILIILFSTIVTVWFGYLVTKSNTALNIALIPKTLKVLIENKNPVEVHNKFKNKNKFEIYNIPKNEYYLLLSRYDGDKKKSVVELIDINSQKLVHSWNPNIKKIIETSKLSKERFGRHNVERYRIKHPFLTKNGDLVFHGGWTGSALAKVDVCSNISWIIDYPFHHSIEMDHKNNLWVPMSFHPQKVTAGLDERDGTKRNFFMDDGIMNISLDGKILFSKSVMQILIENNLKHLIFPGEESYDPIHLNDIQPVLDNGPYYKKGDLFLSFKSNSIILLYRPETNKVIWLKKNPWVYQHDVDILSDKKISIFNNKNLFRPLRIISKPDHERYSNLMIYDFEKNKITETYDVAFEKFKISTFSEGLAEIIDEDIFVSETIHGRLIMFNNKNELLWEYYNTDKNGKMYYLNWSRVFKKNNLKEAIENITKRKCD